MRILHVGKIFDDRSNGVSVVVPKHLEHQSSYATVTLLNLCDFTPKNSDRNYDVIYASNVPAFHTVLDNNKNFDLVVFHEIYRPYFIKAYKELVKRGVPYVIIPHGSLTRDAQLISKRKKLIGNLLLFNNFVKHSAEIQFMSETECKQSNISNHPHFVLGSGLDILGRKKKKFSEEGLKVIYIGRLDVRVKGLDILLEAVSNNKKLFRKNNVTVTIAGTDAKNGRRWLIENINEQKISDLVKIEGPVYGKDKILKLLENDLFTQLSRTEAQCLGLMEAMDLGLPSVVTPGSTFFEIAQKYDVAIPCLGNSKDVAKTLLSASRDKKILDKLSEKSSLYIAANYDWTNVGHQMVQRYSKTITDRR